MTEELSSFEGLDPDIRRGIEELGWTEPMEVQRRVIPVMRSGGDLIVQAITGSGKTGAFGIPIAECIDPKLRAIQALVLAPTRELGIQVAHEVEVIGRHKGIETLPIYGGVAYGPQLEGLERGAQVVAGTPGRILDHLRAGRMKLDRLRVIVMDEADELLSLGFWPDMKEIRSFLPARRQSGLFSATIPERVRSLARAFLKEPEFISLVPEGARSPDEIEHLYYLVTAQEKDASLLRILEYENPDSAIIFCNTRGDVRFVSAFLQRNGYDADMIQGEMSQAAREQVMGRIKAGELRFLVATDVAARGIDISDLSHVISYATPDSPEVYLHRTGRTGRAGKTGTAISLVSGLDIGNFRNLQLVNKIQIREMPLPEGDAVADRIAKRFEAHLERDLRGLGERERRLHEERMLPVIERLAATDEGRRDLSALLFHYLREEASDPASPHVEPAGPPPEPRSSSPPSSASSSASGGGAASGGRPERKPGEEPRRRRRRRRTRSAGRGGP